MSSYSLPGWGSARNSKRYNYFTGLYIMLTASIFLPTANTFAQTLTTRIPESQIQALEFTTNSLHAEGVTPSVTITLPVKDKMRQIRLTPHDLRSEDFRSEITTHSGRTTDRTRVHLFKGVTNEEQGENFYRFTLSVSRDETRTKHFQGFYSNNGDVFSLEPSETPQLYDIRKLTAAEVHSMMKSCGTKAEVGKHNHDGPRIAEANSGLKIVEVATEADYELVRRFGNAAQANARILSIISAVDALFRRQLGMTFRVTFQHAWSVPNDPYSTTNHRQIYSQFANYWNQHFSNRRYDIAHMWSGRDFDGLYWGVASVGDACKHWRYSLVQFLNNPTLDFINSAHEIGHLFNGGHVDCSGGKASIMCAVTNAAARSFSSWNVGRITAHRDKLNCLEDERPTPVNRAPQLRAIGAKTVTEGQTIQFTIQASDPDGDRLSYSASGLPAGASFSNRVFRYTPPAGTVPTSVQSIHKPITFSASDGKLTDAETVQIRVNAAFRRPSQGVAIDNPGRKHIAEGQPFGYRIKALDPANRVLMYSIEGATPPGASLNSSNGLFHWKPAGNQSGNYNVRFKVQNSAGQVARATMTIVVQNRNGIPNLPKKHTLGDFDGNGIAEVMLFRHSNAFWYSRSSHHGGSGATVSRQFGIHGDIPVPGDYNGDNITDRAVYRPKNSTWYILNSGSNTMTHRTFGIPFDIPVAGGDYDNDGRDDLAVFRPKEKRFYYIKSSTGQTVPLNRSILKEGDIPVPCDYNGDGRTQLAVYRPTTGQWFIGDKPFNWGINEDIPVAADYDGDGKCDPAVYRGSNGRWYFYKTKSSVAYGVGGDVPIPADYLGQGKAQPAVWRPREARWFVRGGATIRFGIVTDYAALIEPYFNFARNTRSSSKLARAENTATLSLLDQKTHSMRTYNASGWRGSDRVAAPDGSYILRGDYDGDNRLDIALFNKGSWTIYRRSGYVDRFHWGIAGDIPLAGDFDNDGRTDLAVWRRGVWYLFPFTTRNTRAVRWGQNGDTPIVADFNGDGFSDLGIYRPAGSRWYILDGRSRKYLHVAQWGSRSLGDIPRAIDFDGDGRADKVQFRSSNGIWYVKFAGGSAQSVGWGTRGDIPVPGSFLNKNSTDFAVYRPNNGILYLRSRSGSVTKGISTHRRAGDQIVSTQTSRPIR